MTLRTHSNRLITLLPQPLCKLKTNVSLIRLDLGPDSSQRLAILPIILLDNRAAISPL